MKQKIDFLPRRLTKEEIALAPSNWVRTLSHYRYRRRRALWENKPGYNTLFAAVMAAIAKKDRHLIDIATELTKENMPRDVYLTLVSSAIYCLGAKQEGLKMAREAVKLNQSPLTLLGLAADTDDLDEKEDLAKKVLKENPNDCDALRHLAYARYFKGRREEAERLIDEILVNEPKNILATEFKGNIYFDKKEYDKAIEQYRKINLKPIPFSLQFKICYCYYLLGRVSKAKEIAKCIQGKDPLALELEMGSEDLNELLAEILNNN